MIFFDDVYGDIKNKIDGLDSNISSIYFLKYNGCISYIGQSKCVKQRLYQHLYNKLKPFNDFEYIETESKLLDSVESFYILFHSPAFNKSNCLRINSENDFVSKNGLKNLYITVEEYYAKRDKNLSITQAQLAQYYGVTERTLRNWAKATDGRQHLLQAAKAYYITQNGKL